MFHPLVCPRTSTCLHACTNNCHSSAIVYHNLEIMQISRLHGILFCYTCTVVYRQSAPLVCTPSLLFSLRIWYRESAPPPFMFSVCTGQIHAELSIVKQRLARKRLIFRTCREHSGRKKFRSMYCIAGYFRGWKFS